MNLMSSRPFETEPDFAWKRYDSREPRCTKLGEELSFQDRTRLYLETSGLGQQAWSAGKYRFWLRSAAAYPKAAMCQPSFHTWQPGQQHSCSLLTHWLYSAVHPAHLTRKYVSPSKRRSSLSSWTSLSSLPSDQASGGRPLCHGSL